MGDRMKKTKNLAFHMIFFLPFHIFIFRVDLQQFWNTILNVSLMEGNLLPDSSPQNPEDK